MDRQTRYSPYEELVTQLDKQTHHVHLSTPWASVEAEIPETLTPAVARVCAAINREGTADADELNEFLETFKDYYFCYVESRPLTLVPEHCSRFQLGRRLDARSTPQQWVDSFAPSVAHAIRMEGGWDFDVEQVLARSRIPGTNAYDPVAAFRAIMRHAFKRYGVQRYAARARLLDFLEKTAREDEPLFLETMKYYLRQYHHVTTTSSDCLIPAIETMPEAARELVVHLAGAEHGHGEFTGASLSRLNVKNPSLIPVEPTACALMDFLKASAHVSPVAFSCLFNLFELPGEQDEDPVGALLRGSSKPESARGVDAHFTLNKNGAHFTSGLCLLDHVGAVDEYTVIEAARVSELHLMLLEALCAGIQAYGERLVAEKKGAAAVTPEVAAAALANPRGAPALG